VHMLDSQTLQDRLSRAERYINWVLHDLNLPGLAVGIVQNGSIIFLKGFGKARPDRNVTDETPFVIGSLSKSFTAVALLQLREAGKINLDAPVQSYLPWFRVSDDLYASVQITTRHLLTHTSGLSRFAGRELLGQTKNVGREQRVRELKNSRLVHPVGTVSEYSNCNYLVAGLLIEAVSGTFYENYLYEHILRPLNMRYHTFLSEQSALYEGMATGYRWWFGLPVPAHVPFIRDALPAAFIVSSVHDMVRWLLFHLSEGTVDAVSLLSPEGMKELHRPQVAADAHSTYALGWRVEQIEDEFILRHGGETANFLSEMVVIPGQQLGVVVLMNCNNVAVARMCNIRIATGLARLLLELEPPRSKLSLRMFYTLVDSLVLVLTGIQLLSFIKLVRRTHSNVPLWRKRLATMVDLLLPLVYLWRLPRIKQVDSPWSLLYWYAPDITNWILGMSIVSFTKAFFRWLRR